MFNAFKVIRKRPAYATPIPMNEDPQDRSKLILPGQVVRHFKRDFCDFAIDPPFQYLYEVIGEATHTETKEPLIVYRALYGDHAIYCRPAKMFMSEVDHEKYPNAKQKYRLEIAQYDIATGKYL